MTTPTDSAMTAERIRHALQNMAEACLCQHEEDLCVPCKTVAVIRSLEAERAKLTADLARVVGERDALKEDYASSVLQRTDQAVNLERFVNRMYAAEDIALAAEAKSARLEEALKVPEVWSQTERDGMAAAFDKADGKRGHYETLFAVAAWLLRHRAAFAKERADNLTGERKPDPGASK
jgi:hypothetical protein